MTDAANERICPVCLGTTDYPGAGPCPRCEEELCDAMDDY